MKAMKAQDQQIEKPSFGELISRLATESGQLVKDEIALAKQEVGQKILQSADSGKLFAVGGVLGIGALFCLCAFLILGIGVWLPLWVSAFLVMCVFGVAAFSAFRLGISRWRNFNKGLEQTMETLEEDKRWIKQLDSARQP
jgi:Flp pilus assembly protein TadB